MDGYDILLFSWPSPCSYRSGLGTSLCQHTSKVFPSIPYKEALEAYEVIGCQFAAASCDTNSNTLDTMDYVLWCSIVVTLH